MSDLNMSLYTSWVKVCMLKEQCPICLQAIHVYQKTVFCICMSLSAFIVLCLPSLCSVRLHCALSASIVLCFHLHFLDAFLCDYTGCHAEDYKNWCYHNIFCISQICPPVCWSTESDVCLLLLLTPEALFSALCAYCYSQVTLCSLQYHTA